MALVNTYGPTANQIAGFERAAAQLGEIKAEIKSIIKETIPELEKDLKAAGAPWIEGQGLVEN